MVDRQQDLGKVPEKIKYPKKKEKSRSNGPGQVDPSDDDLEFKKLCDERWAPGPEKNDSNVNEAEAEGLWGPDPE